MSRPALVKIPPSAWRVLEETLLLDAESSAFDRELRRSIKDAIGSVEFIELKDGWALVMPNSAWAIIEETLTLDMNSRWYDRNTRRMVRKALDQAEVGELIGPKDWSPRKTGGE